MVNSIQDPGGFKRINLDTKSTTAKGDKSPSNASVSISNNEQDVHLSSTSHQIAILKQLAMGEPDVNRARVEFLRSEIENGSYKVQHEVIADKMMADLKQQRGV